MRLISLVAITALAGCVAQLDDASDPEVADTEQAATTAFANDKPAFDFFVAKGLTNFQAAGIVGNLDQESGVNPASVQYGGGPGRGIAQWSVGGRWDTSSHDNVLWYAGTQGESSGSLNLQLEFIWYELTNIGYGYSQLTATTNVTDATVAFQDRYEICGTCDSTQRVSYAKAVLAAYGQIAFSAHYVSQSWPLASAPAMTIKCGETIPAKITLKNLGTKTWDSNTRLGTTQQRDRASIFAGSDWIAPNRAAAIAGTVAPGADGTFEFAFHGPTGAACVPGTYKEYFGLVQEGVAWFSDTGQGGPADDVIEALIDLQPGDGSAGSGSGSGTGSDGGSDAGTGDNAASGGCNASGGGAGALLVVVLFAFPRRRRVCDHGACSAPSRSRR
ncbi:MAG: phage tail tip lysozyme [Acidobacteriota bacterium]